MLDIRHRNEFFEPANFPEIFLGFSILNAVRLIPFHFRKLVILPQIETSTRNHFSVKTIANFCAIVIDKANGNFENFFRGFSSFCFRLFRCIHIRFLGRFYLRFFSGHLGRLQSGLSSRLRARYFGRFCSRFHRGFCSRFHRGFHGGYFGRFCSRFHRGFHGGYFSRFRSRSCSGFCRGRFGRFRSRFCSGFCRGRFGRFRIRFRCSFNHKRFFLGSLALVFNHNNGSIRKVSVHHKVSLILGITDSKAERHDKAKEQCQESGHEPSLLHNISLSSH